MRPEDVTLLQQVQFLFLCTEGGGVYYALYMLGLGPGNLEFFGPQMALAYWQGCGSGSGSVLDPYSIGSLDPDPDPYSEYGSGSRRAKMPQKSRQYLVKVHVLKCWMASFEN